MYNEIGVSSDPKIIGVNNGIYQVELKDKKSFVNEVEYGYYADYFNGRVDKFLVEGFENMVFGKISTLTYFAMKSAKETDFIRFSPCELGLDFIVSAKCLSILSRFNLPDYIKIHASIDRFPGNFHVVGFPMISNRLINFEKSRFLDIINRKPVSFSSVDDFLNREKILIQRDLIVLSNIPDWDIIQVQGNGIFFSERLIEALHLNGITGIEKKKACLQ